MTTRREMMVTLAAAAGAAACGGLFAAPENTGRQAKYWHNFGDDVQCDLCPHDCILTDGKVGPCRNRMNKKGVMANLGYGAVCATNVDPVEKKPLYHFLPGSTAYSIAIAGCSLRCKNCQNSTISQVSPQETGAPYLDPQKVVDAAKQSGTASIAYTYSEPTVWLEYVYDTAKLARKAGIRNVLVTSGYVNEEPFTDLMEFLDSAHIDLKSFDETIYRNLNAGNLKPILDTMVIAKKKGLWFEIINLVVPQWTDNLEMIRKMCAWIRDNIGTDTPLHFSRFFPQYQLAQLYPTPTGILQQAQKIAFEEKLKYVYVGNVPEIDSNTYCPQCKSLLIERNGYRVTVKGMKNGACAKCSMKIPGVWA